MTRTLTLVSHTHWDREWYQPYQEYRMRLVQLTDRLLDLLKRDQDYRCFTLDGQTIVLEDYLEIRPEREEDLRQLVKTGRLLIGPWYILPDEFLVSPEATIRNLLLGDSVASSSAPRWKSAMSPTHSGISANYRKYCAALAWTPLSPGAELGTGPPNSAGLHRTEPRLW